jgi:high-affinity Fe2+/Pb2+ permease
MVGAFVLAAGGVRLALDAQNRRRGLLMLAAAAVLVMNVMIWTV